MSSSTPTATLGIVEWEITSGRDEAMLYRGRRDLRSGDVDVFPAMEWVRSGPKPKPWTAGAAVSTLFDFYLKQIYLEGGFLVGLTSRPARDPANLGIALSALRTPGDRTHSFAFFAIDAEDHAAHPTLGEMRIQVAEGPKGWEVTYTEFLTDITLRIESDQQDNIGCLLGLFGRGPAVLWRVRLLKGSYVHWPSAT